MGEILLETPRLTVICHFNYSCILNQCKHMLFKFGKIIAVKFSNDNVVGSVGKLCLAVTT